MTDVANETGTRPEDIVGWVVASLEGCDDPRLREVLQALVRHLHAFAAEVALTRREWEAGIRFLTAAGDITDDRRQEFVLLSDTLGLSTLVDTLENDKLTGVATESTLLGPFWAAESPWREHGESMIVVPSGTPCLVRGRVLDVDGAPVAGAVLDVWQNGSNRMYAVQDPSAPQENLRGRYRSREDGSYAFLGVRPTDYTIPDDGPVGKMLEATGRHPWRAAHVHVIVTADGFEPLVTELFDRESSYLGSDTVFGVKPSLVRDFVPRAADDPETPPGVDGEWCSLENDFVLVRA
jgi:hydroxyquinol 1,2-dioxygenase